MTLLDKYGYCIVPKNTFLFHKGYIKKDAESVFFGITPLVAHINPGRDKKIQIWKTKSEIQLLFMIMYVYHYSWTKSAIIEIYQDFFPNDTLCDDIEIKYHDKERRNKLVDKLKEQNVIGWFSSYDDKYELEICLFRDENFFNIIEPFKETTINKLYSIGFNNPLKNILLYPNEKFYNNSVEKLENFPFKNYKRHVNECINEEMQFGNSFKYCQNANYFLRTKLKI
jgi:hypothetical protein